MRAIAIVSRSRRRCGATGECRFALVFEGGSETVQAGQNLAIPVKGQIAVIVYVTMGDAVPQLAIVSTSSPERDGRQVPLLRVRNTGRAHGRLEGILEGTDAADAGSNSRRPDSPYWRARLARSRSTWRPMAMLRPTVTFPISIRGTLEWNGKTTPFEARFAP